MSGKRILIPGMIIFLMLAGGNACKRGSAKETDKETVEVDPKKNKGIGPVKSVELGSIDAAKVATGRRVFKLKCSACHKINEKLTGPAIAGVTERRSPEWIMNMILNTKEMVEKDPIAKDMVRVYFTKMTFQDVSREEARGLLEYFRSIDKK